MKATIALLFLSLTKLSACSVDSNGSTISTCELTFNATISELRDAIAGGATTAAEMAAI